MSDQFIRFVGNCPGNVSKDARYSVRYEKGQYVVGLFYRSTDGELWYPTSSSHPELVETINEIKIHFNGAPGGTFYINEYKQVLVPVGEAAIYYYAGEYSAPLTFEFEGQIISGEALDQDRNPLHPGAPWTGPHPGIPYVLKAGGNDVYYRYMVRPGVQKEIRLSKCIGVEEAKGIGQELSKHKGYHGGRFYVNEFANAFAPIEGHYGLEYVFLKKIELANWFPKPEIVQEETAATDLGTMFD
jgi:hypothetical protein